MNLRYTLAAAALAASAFAAPAFAGSTGTTATVGGGTASVKTDITQVLFTNAASTTAINYFNPASVSSPGFTVTLTDVKLQYAAAASTTGTLTNTSSSAQTFTFAANLSTYLDGGNAPAVVYSDFGLGSPDAVTQTFPKGTYSSLAPNTPVAYPTSGPSNLSTLSPLVTLTDAASLTAFTGTGAFTLGLSSISGTTIVGGGNNITASLNTNVGGTFQVTYDYTLTAIPVTPVPEPATIALLGAGLLGLGLVRSRKAG